jgi:hypothetical protein
VYKKVVKFSFTQQKIFWVLVFSIRIWYLAYPTDRSKGFKRHFAELKIRELVISFLMSRTG